MAKVTGPLLSIAAAGSVGGILNFRGDGRNPTASQHRATPSRITEASAANRLRAAHAASAWHSLTTQERQQWSAAALGAALPPFGYYLQQWQRQGATLANPAQLPVTTP